MRAKSCGARNIRSNRRRAWSAASPGWPAPMAPLTSSSPGAATPSSTASMAPTRQTANEKRFVSGWLPHTAGRVRPTPDEAAPGTSVCTVSACPASCGELPVDACDVRQLDCLQRIFESVRCVRGGSGSMPATEVIDPAEYIARLEREASAEPPDDPSGPAPGRPPFSSTGSCRKGPPWRRRGRASGGRTWRATTRRRPGS